MWQKEYGTTGRQLPGLTLSFTAVVSFLVNNNKMKIETQELVGLLFFSKTVSMALEMKGKKGSHTELMAVIQNSAA